MAGSLGPDREVTHRLAAAHEQRVDQLRAGVAAAEVDELRAPVGRDRVTELEQLSGMKRFRERLARSWAIETGVIERVYDLDRGTTELLIEKGIDASLIDPGLDRWRASLASSAE